MYALLFAGRMAMGVGAIIIANTNSENYFKRNAL